MESYLKLQVKTVFEKIIPGINCSQLRLSELTDLPSLFVIVCSFFCF